VDTTDFTDRLHSSGFEPGMGIAGERSTCGGNSRTRRGVDHGSSRPLEVAFKRARDSIHIRGIDLTAPKSRPVSRFLAQARDELRFRGNLHSLGLLVL
jgi:hypothetical protein